MKKKPWYSVQIFFGIMLLYNLILLIENPGVFWMIVGLFFIFAIISIINIRRED